MRLEVGGVGELVLLLRFAFGLLLFKLLEGPIEVARDALFVERWVETPGAIDAKLQSRVPHASKPEGRRAAKQSRRGYSGPLSAILRFSGIAGLSPQRRRALTSKGPNMKSHSTGPGTPQDKQRSSLTALRHAGLTGQTVVIPTVGGCKAFRRAGAQFCHNLSRMRGRIYFVLVLPRSKTLGLPDGPFA